MKTRIMNTPVLLGLVALAALSVMPVRALAASPSDPPSADVKVDTAPVALPLPPSPDPSAKRNTVALIAAGVAVVGASVGTVFGFLALQNKNDYRRDPTYSNTDQGNNDAAYADGAIALAVAAAVTSLVLYVTNGPSSDETPDPAAPKKRSATFSASPFVTSHGGGAGALLRF
jgi:hypothetical protein